MNDNKLEGYFIITKTISGRVTVPIKNDETQAVLNIVLTEDQPSKRLPASWAVNVFSSEDAYRMYKMGYITFDKNQELMKLAYDTGHYFDTELNFEPVKADHLEIIKQILLSGNTQQIIPLLNSDKSKRDVVSVATKYIKDLKVEVIRFLETNLKVQLSADGE